MPITANIPSASRRWSRPHGYPGDVVEIGFRRHKGHKVGDRSLPGHSTAAAGCVYCRQGRYNLCTEKHVLVSNRMERTNSGNGGRAGKTVVRLPDNLSYEGRAR